ncbi:MAG: BrnT family toxin [Rhodospirillaceae bacterium]|nr:BrnT family toxin [Rhodospirillaceae bacterium]
MEFEFDAAKSAANLRKHGIDFEAAKELWDDLGLIEFPANSAFEPRFSVVGRIGSKHWSAIVTYRNARVRIISVRRARNEEIKRYEGA